MSDERKRENEEEKLKDFFHNVIGIKSEAVLEVLAENSEICKLKAKTLLMKDGKYLIFADCHHSGAVDPGILHPHRTPGICDRT